MEEGRVGWNHRHVVLEQRHRALRGGRGRLRRLHRAGVAAVRLRRPAQGRPRDGKRRCSRGQLRLGRAQASASQGGWIPKRDAVRHPVRGRGRVQRVPRHAARGRRRQPAVGGVRRGVGRWPRSWRRSSASRSSSWLFGVIFAGVGGVAPWLLLSLAGSPGRKAPRAAARRAHDHGELAARRPQLPAVARHRLEGDPRAGGGRVHARRRRGSPGPPRGGRARGARGSASAARTSSGRCSR